MRLTYEIVKRDQKRFVYLSEVPQYLDCDDLVSWMREVRDDDPDLYAELVPLYIALTLPTDTRNPRP